MQWRVKTVDKRSSDVNELCDDKYEATTGATAFSGSLWCHWIHWDVEWRGLFFLSPSCVQLVALLRPMLSDGTGPLCPRAKSGTRWLDCGWSFKTVHIFSVDHKRVFSLTATTRCVIRHLSWMSGRILCVILSEGGADSDGFSGIYWVRNKSCLWDI